MTTDNAQGSPVCGGSEDAGERWFDLIRAPGDLTMIARSLRERGRSMRIQARSRKWSGPDAARARQMLRDEADECMAIAIRAEGMIPRG